MAFLKGLALAVIGFFLFVSLSALGAGVSVNLTVLNPGFINGQIKNLDLPDVIREAVLDNGAANDAPQAIRNFLKDGLPEYSNELKEAAAAAVNRFYDYLLDRTDTLDLQDTLGETVFAPELIYSLAEKIDWPDMAEELMKENVGQNVDPVFIYLIDYIDDAAVKMEAWANVALRDIVPPLQQYLLGSTDSLDIHVPLDEPFTTLYVTLFDVYTAFPPPELSGLTPNQKIAAFNEFFYFQLTAGWPDAIEIDSSFFAGAPESLNHGLVDLKGEIERLKGYVGDYWLVFYGLILFVVLLIGLAYLVLRDKREIFLYCGSVFFAFGLVGFVGIMVANAVIGVNTDFGNVPSAFQLWLPGLVESALRPFLIFSIFAGALGISAIITSLVLPPDSRKSVLP
ncbi:hypothetical protein DGWBC_0466 [Dehalogenimonas sp. WBC-2]|nr:hypothetical protein DGWBC_0466 [Dehalogenimonas sp. WBC-2]